MERTVSLGVPRDLVDVVSQYWETLCEVVQGKFSCSLRVEGVERAPSLGVYSPSPGSLDMKWEGKLDSGVLVCVCKADLTHFPVDALVNAANESLSHHGGLAAALSRAGGRQIQQESDAYIKCNGPLKTGDAIVLGPGFLPCRKLIHAVGPRVTNTGDLQDAKLQLQKTIWNILNRVSELNLRTVAIPAISSGIFNFPLQQCADTIVEALRHYCSSSRSSRSSSSSSSSSPPRLPSQVFLVNHDDPTVMEMERACRQLLARGTLQPYSRAASTWRRGGGGAPTSLYSVELGNVVLTLQQGAIEDQETDVIVNTADENKDLTLGAVSQAISMKAGPRLQEELWSTTGDGDIMVTGPHQLGCKKVFHTFCLPMRNPQAVQKLQNSIKKCLWMAVPDHSSIAFPAIGTGKLGFRNSEVASIMSKEVQEFARNCPIKMKVHFVIFPQDKETFKAFEVEIQSLQSAVSGGNVRAHRETQEWNTSSDRAGPLSLTHEPTPKIVLSLGSTESMQEAAKWLSGLWTNLEHVTINNNFIQHLSFQQQQLLSHLMPVVTIEEFFTQGHACMNIKGLQRADVLRAVLRVEEMLHNAQKELVCEKLSEMEKWMKEGVEYQRISVNRSTSEFSDLMQDFRRHDLRVVKVESVTNGALRRLFELKQKQMASKTFSRMFQSIPAQFCETISRIGFQAELAPPEAPTCGEGIYFTSSLKKAQQLWRYQDEQYLYFVEAQVLKGKSTAGKPGLILPPEGDGGTRFDSVTGGQDVCVVFSGYQALPTHIITCERQR